MGIRAVLVDQDGQEQSRLRDPMGGSFDAAEDFDRLLEDPPNELDLWASIDPYSETSFSSSEMVDFLQELEQVLRMSEPGAERRGLKRVQALALLCRENDELTLSFLGEDD